MNTLPISVRNTLDFYIKEINQLNVITGLYLHGSIALHAYEEGKSDIDFVATTSRALTEQDAYKLLEIHEKLALACNKPLLDGIYILADNYDDECYYYNEGRFTKTPHHVSITWWLLKNKGITIFGPPLKITVQTDDLLVYVKRNMNEYWGERTNELEERYKGAPTHLVEEEVEWTVLGMLRQYYTLQEHDIISKLGAGEYGLSTLDTQWHPLIQEAINIRKGNPKRYFATNEERMKKTIDFTKELIRFNG
ncbi:aminoglycoside adenylyltransferase domain-containing protein [Sutcliffiella rhizosphaerae]|uniref:DUF4111 domain-containing protein n=1 Tax=Sutcliffiella rhizosphaerae TaxID=2880967 RepID=A0ABN8ABF0_9BACI|nr:aminoglycoside adenylyltransferase domain-containing protein [Sutcliffiella rhizosphaerae]CAG9621246.1 hypothetical protein BACCIP111883_02018 [Sutcliffiella rhizosphaerae]